MSSSKPNYKKNVSIPIPSIKDLIDAKVHIGHRCNACNPKMKKAIFGKQSGIHIIDVRYSQKALKNALEKLYDDFYKGKKVLFVATDPNYEEAVKQLAEDTNQHYCLKLLGGIMTNWKTVYSSTKSLVKLNRIIESYEAESPNPDQESKLSEESKMYGMKNLVRSDIINLKNKRDRLTKVFGGLTKIKSIPDTVFVFSAKRDESVVHECFKMGVNVMGIVDTNCTINGLNFPIPGNDDSIFSILLYSNAIKNVAKKAEEDRKKNMSSEVSQEANTNPSRYFSKQSKNNEEKSESSSESKKIGVDKKSTNQKNLNTKSKNDSEGKNVSHQKSSEKKHQSKSKTNALEGSKKDDSDLNKSK